MTDYVTKCINDVLSGKPSYCKFLSANDSGETGGHQAGILISKTAKEMFWNNEDLQNNHILKIRGEMNWQDDFHTTCTITWYKSKNELRITGFGRGKSPLNPEFTGALFVLLKESEGEYKSYLFNTDEEITEFLDAFGLTPAETNRPLEINSINSEIKEKVAIDSFIASLDVDFPSSIEMAQSARLIQYKVYANQNMVKIGRAHV